MPRKPKVSKPIRNAKAAAKQTVKQSRQIGKTTKAAKSAIKKIAKAFKKKPAKKATSKTSKKSTPKKSVAKKAPAVKPKTKRSDLPSTIKLKNIKQFQGRSWASIVNDAPLLAKLDKLKKKDEYFVGSVFGNQTHKFFRNGAEVIQQLNQYVESYQGDDKKMIDSFTIGRLQGEPSNYAKEVQARIDANKERALQERKELGEKYGKTTAEGKTKTFRDLAKDANARAEALEDRLAKLERMFQELTKAPKKAAKKKAAKKATKKSTKKSTGKVAKKNASKTGGRSKAGTTSKSARAKSKPTNAVKKKSTGGQGKKAAGNTRKVSKPKAKSKATPSKNVKKAIKKSTKKKR